MNQPAQNSMDAAIVTDDGRIAADDLQRSLRNAINSGRIGTPVCLRFHWQVERTDGALNRAALFAMRLGDECLNWREPRWELRRSAEYQLNLMATDSQGRVLLATISTGRDRDLSLTLIGNIGTARLDHAAMSLSDTNLEGSEQCEWFKQLERDLKTSPRV